MAGRQRTFEVIPATLVKSNGNQPTRMTSKQAKKAYQQASRGPRISRAEQRLLDAAELERQKKEFEREKAVARARAAREKKAAKENAEKEARRKMGVPEPSRFVRASQPTISRFVTKGNNGKRTWQEMKMDSVAEDSDGTMSDSGLGENDEGQTPANRIPAEEDSEDEFGDFPSLSQSDLLEKIESSMASTKAGGNTTTSTKPRSESPRQPPSQELPQRKSSEDEYPLDDSQFIADMVNTQLLSEAAEAAQKSDGVAVTKVPVPKRTTHTPMPSKKPVPRILPMPEKNMSKPTRPGFSKQPVSGLATQALGPGPDLHKISLIMPPPPLPLNGKKAISFAPTPQKSTASTSVSVKPINKPQCDVPPSATQVFLETHLDDFLPSPTQEMRELLSDTDDLPSNSQISRELSPELPKRIVDNLPLNKPSMNIPHLTPIVEENFDGFICTQDLILSSQELLEITTPSRAPTKTTIGPAATKEKPPPKEKPRFFEEKEDDILYAVLHESKTVASHPLAPGTHAKERRRPFFEEKEDDQLVAAIRESKMMAAKYEVVIKMPLKEGNANVRRERTLKRVVSSASTDYGEGEFSGGEWDSFGL